MNLFRFLADIDIKIMLTHINEIKYRSNNLSHERILPNDRQLVIKIVERKSLIFFG